MGSFLGHDDAKRAGRRGKGLFLRQLLGRPDDAGGYRSCQIEDDRGCERTWVLVRTMGGTRFERFRACVDGDDGRSQGRKGARAFCPPPRPANEGKGVVEGEIICGDKNLALWCQFLGGPVLWRWLPLSPL